MRRLEDRPDTGTLTMPFPHDMGILPESRWPTRLPEETFRIVMEGPIPVGVRQAQVDPGATGQSPASVVVVIHDGLVYTRMCLESLLANTGHPNYEVIVVDNGSSEASRRYLERLAAGDERVRVLFNQANRGFAAANNQALATARGEHLVLLNNDTLVPPGWLSRLVAHLQDPGVALVGPVTNRSRNESEIATTYRTYGQLLSFAEERGRRHARKTRDVKSLTMFCLAMTRQTCEKLGPLDERFELGLFEDEDYCVRARQLGFRMVSAEDAFVHHFGQASIGKLAATGQYGTLFHSNRRRFEEKWGIRWEPQSRRFDPDYQALIGRLQESVQCSVPSRSTVAVISKGDERMLELGSRQGWHFPQDETGTYAGYNPPDSEAAIHHLENLRARGADFLVLPKTAFWWLQHYSGLEDHLNRYQLVFDEPDTCLIYRLHGTQGDHVR